MQQGAKVLQGVRILCPQCGYNLRGLSQSRCPECGLDIECSKVRPTCDVPLVDWLHEAGWRATLCAVWRTMWLPERSLSCSGYRPGLGRSAAQIFAGALVWHATLFLLWTLVGHSIGYALGIRTFGVLEFLLPGLLNVLYQSAYVMNWILLAGAVGLCWAVAHREHRESHEYLTFAAIVFAWTVPAELTGLILRDLYGLLCAVDLLPPHAMIHPTLWYMIGAPGYSRYGVFCALLLMGLKVLEPGRRILRIGICVGALLLGIGLAQGLSGAMRHLLS